MKKKKFFFPPFLANASHQMQRIIFFTDNCLLSLQFAVCLYREIMMAGRKLGAKNVGRSAVDCLRIERAVPQFGKELTSFISPKESGLIHWVQLGKVRRKPRGAGIFSKTMVCMKLEHFFLGC